MKKIEPIPPVLSESQSSFANFPPRITQDQKEEMKMKMKKMEEMKKKTPLSQLPTPSQTSHSKTLMKQKRFQKLMKILKKIKHVKRPVKAVRKPLKSKANNDIKGKSENFRVVNEDGSIKWGYRTPSGLFQVRILSSGLPHCLDVGVFPHPFSCKKFVNCYRNPGQGITGSIYQCPSYLAFDPVGGRCNWVNEIVCTSG